MSSLSCPFFRAGSESVPSSSPHQALLLFFSFRSGCFSDFLFNSLRVAPHNPHGRGLFQSTSVCIFICDHETLQGDQGKWPTSVLQRKKLRLKVSKAQAGTTPQVF